MTNGGIGCTLWSHSQEDEDYATLITGFMSAIQSFGRTELNELQYIQLVPKRIVFLPSQNIFTLVTITSNDHSAEECLSFLEDIRDQIIENHWTDIKNENPMFFSNVSELKKNFIPYVKNTMLTRGWLKLQNMNV